MLAPYACEGSYFQMHRTTALLLTFASTALTTGCASCREKNPSQEPDAAATVTAASDVPPATSAPPAASSAAEPAATPAAASAAPEKPASGGPWNGTYHCFNNMHLTQSGSHVTGVLFPGSTMPSNVSCTVTGDKCTGTVTAISISKGKPPKTVESKGVTLTRHPNGDVTYLGARESSPTFCRR